MRNEITYQNVDVILTISSDESIKDIKELVAILPLHNTQKNTKIEIKPTNNPIENKEVKSNNQQVVKNQPEETYKPVEKGVHLPPLWLVECDDCGKLTFLNRNTCKDEMITCVNCKHDIEIDESMVAPAEYECECGERYRLGVHSVSDTVSINCRNCGTPIDLTWNKKKRRYEKM